MRTRSTSHCIPDDIPESQLVAIFQKMAKALKQNFPHDMNQPAVSIVGVTMRRAFPCPVRASSPLPFCSVYSSRTASTAGRFGAVAAKPNPSVCIPARQQERAVIWRRAGPSRREAIRGTSALRVL